MGKGLFVEFQTSPLALRTGIPFTAPVEHCRSFYNDTDCSPAQHGGLSIPRPGFKSRPEHHLYSYPTRYFLRITGTVAIPTEAMRAIARPTIPTPSRDITSEVVISIKNEPLVEVTELEASDSKYRI